MIVILFAVSIVAFVIIQLPPGDWLTNQIMRSISIGQINEEQISLLERRCGLDLPVYAQYAKWMWNMVHGDFGRSLEFNEPVRKLIGKRLPLTVAISLINSPLRLCCVRTNWNLLGHASVPTSVL